MKQKVVIRVQMEDAKKRTKAMKAAVGLPGVLSAAIEGADKLVVIGDGVDSVALTTLLRKRLRFAELVSVSAVGENKERKEEKKVECNPTAAWPLYGAGYPTQYYCVREAKTHYQDPNCCIM